MMNMASWNDGWKRTRYPGIWEKNGSYRVRVRAIVPATGKMKEVNRVFDGLTLKQAVAKQVQQRDELQKATTERVRTRVGAFARLWIESKGPVVGEYTLEGYAGTLENHVLPILGMYFYDAVDHLEVQGMVNRWLSLKKADGSPYSRESLKDWFRLFRNMTRDAMVQLGLDRDPTLRISFGEDDVDGQEGDKEDLSIAEGVDLLRSMHQKRPGSFAILTAKQLTGQRFCHVSALKWSDIDWSQMVIRFRRKQVRGIVGPISKKKPVPKEIPIVNELAIVLVEHGRRLGRLGYPVGLDDWVFPSRNRKLKQPSSLVTAIRESAKEANIDKHITPHMMRYLFNDVLRLAGVDEVTRRALTGHVTKQMTEHYSTVRLDEKRAAMDAAAAKLREAGGDLGGDRGRKEKAA
jgi:integrase